MSNKQSLTFKTKTEEFSYRGHITLECCKGIYGSESKTFECLNNKSTLTDIIFEYSYNVDNLIFTININIKRSSKHQIHIS